MPDTDSFLPPPLGEGGVGAPGALAPAPIDILLDGRSHSLPAGTTLSALVASLGHPQDKVTTAVNGLFVRRDARAEYVLQPGDAVLLFQPITGG